MEKFHTMYPKKSYTNKNLKKKFGFCSFHCPTHTSPGFQLEKSFPSLIENKFKKREIKKKNKKPLDHINKIHIPVPIKTNPNFRLYFFLMLWFNFLLIQGGYQSGTLEGLYWLAILAVYYCQEWQSFLLKCSISSWPFLKEEMNHYTYTLADHLLKDHWFWSVTITEGSEIFLFFLCTLLSEQYQDSM